MRVISVLLMHFVCSFSGQTKISEAKNFFSSGMFPDFDNYTAINSSAIAVDWRPSWYIADYNLTQFYGNLTITAYAAHQLSTYSTILVYPLTKLNESGTIVVANLQADTIYSVRVHSRSQQSHLGTALSDSLTHLVRTYTISK